MTTLAKLKQLWSRFRSSRVPRALMDVYGVSVGSAASYTSLPKPILGYYSGSRAMDGLAAFEAAFVVLHPFTVLPCSENMSALCKALDDDDRYDDVVLPMAVRVSALADSDVKVFPRFNQAGWEPYPVACCVSTRQEHLIYSDCDRGFVELVDVVARQTLSWANALRRTRLGDFDELARELVRCELMEAVPKNTAAVLNDVDIPEFHTISRQLEPAIGMLFKAAGFETVDLILEDIKIASAKVAALISWSFRSREYRETGEVSVFDTISSPDRELVLISNDYWWGCDFTQQPYSVLFGRRAVIEDALKAAPLEGFFCTDQTAFNWYAR